MGPRQPRTMSFIKNSNAGIYVGEYQKQAWVFVGEITNMHQDALNGKVFPTLNEININ